MPDIKNPNNNLEPTKEKSDLGTVLPRRIEEEMETSYLDYAMSVIVSRALPDVRDGLKPVHRRILVTMNDLNLKHTAKHRKSAKICGDVSGNYHPHGEAIVYPSMVRLAQTFAMRYPLVNGQGNFGSVDGDNPAAMRYTEAKMTKIAEEMLTDLDKDTVNYQDNYDGTRKEPQFLPAKLPNLLVNGAMGIAVGMATNIPPHNLGEVCDATIRLIDHPDSTVEDLCQFVLGPDFPTAAQIYDSDEIKNAYAQGKGRIVMRAKAEIVEGKKSAFKIIISEIPYQVNKSVLVTQIADLVKNKKIVGIADVRDESDKDGIRVVIDLKKDAYPKKILNQLYQYTQMQEAFHINMLALVDGIKPTVLNLKNILEEYLKHRQKVIFRRTQYELNQAKNRLHILEGLLIALKQIDEVIKTIKASENREEAKVRLEKKLALTEIQANAILEMKLATLAHLERTKIELEFDQLKKLITKLTEILENPQMILDIIKEELKNLKKNFPSERKTRIYRQRIESFEKEDLIPNRKVMITLTRGNYIKRMPISVCRSQHRGGKGVIGMTTKEEDLVEHLLIANNHDDILFFTSSGRVLSSKAYEISLGSRRSKGQAIVNLLQINPNDFITGIINVAKSNHAKYLLMVTEKGQIKKTPLANFQKIRKSGLNAIKLRKDDFLKWVRPTTGEDQIIIVSKNGQAIKFKESLIRPMGRSAGGMRGIRLKPKDAVVGMDVLSPAKISGVNIDADTAIMAHDVKLKSFSSDLLVVTEKGYGKKTALKNYPLQSRGGIGLRTARITEKTGPIIQTKITENEKADLIIFSKRGQVIRTPIKNVKRLGRATSGVRLMKLNLRDSVASVTILIKEPMDEIEDKERAKDRQEIANQVAARKLKKSVNKTAPKKPKQAKIKKKPVRKTSTKKQIVQKKTTKAKPKKLTKRQPAPGGKTQKLSRAKKPKKTALKTKTVKPPKPKTIVPGFVEKKITPPTPKVVQSDEPNYWGKDSTLWKKRKI